jgi:Tfp pilus assembly protein PilO
MLFSSQKFNSRRRFLTQIIISGLLLSLLICSSCFFINRIKLANQEVEARKLSLKNMQSENEKVAQLRQEHEEAKPYFSQINSFFQTKEEIINVLSDLEMIAGQTNNIIRVDMAKEKEIDEETQSLRYQISLQGNMKSFLSYSEALEKLPTLFRMEKIDISIPSGNNEEGTMLFQISLFLKKEREEIH